MTLVYERKLIAAVRGHPILYNAKSRTYGNIIKRDIIWGRIAKEIGKRVEECKQRWRSLRDRYVRERKKLLLPQQADANGAVWELYAEMEEFLRDAFIPRHRQSVRRTVDTYNNTKAVLNKKNELDATDNREEKHTRKRRRLSQQEEGKQDINTFDGDTKYTFPFSYEDDEEEQTTGVDDPLNSTSLAHDSVVHETTRCRLSDNDGEDDAVSIVGDGDVDDEDDDGGDQLQMTSSEIQKLFSKLEESIASTQQQKQLQISGMANAVLADDTMDENDLFMVMIAKKMKKLPPDSRLRLQEKFLKEVNDEILIVNTLS